MKVLALPAALLLLVQDAGLTPVAPPQGLREHPVRSPIPPNAVALSAGVAPPPGSVALEPNMPGHRRFRPPLFPDAGWDSPMAGTTRDYAAYLGVYWRTPYLAPASAMAAYPGLEVPGWTAPGPYKADIARSQSSPDEEALFERRMAFLAERVMASAPFRAPHGTSIEPELLIEGYGTEFGPKARPVMRGAITFRLNVIQPHTGGNERIGSRIRSHQPAVWLKLWLNPGFANCELPHDRTARGVRCLQSRARLASRGARPGVKPLAAGLLGLDPAIYAGSAAAADLRMLKMEYGGGTAMSSELSRGRLHPHDPLGRAIGACLAIDWPALLDQAAAIG